MMRINGHVGWESPANIALVKYWGKHPNQIPMNASVSFVLKQSVVRMSLDYASNETDAGRLTHFTLNGKPNAGFQNRIGAFIKTLVPYFPFLVGMDLSIASESTFPHSAGIASSAAAFSALALNLCSIEKQLTGAINTDCLGISRDSDWVNVFNRGKDAGNEFSGDREDAGFILKASFIARLGSGSACRSLQDGFVAWGNSAALPGSDDRYAIRVENQYVSPVFNSLRDAVLIIDDTVKKVSSSAGHALMHHHAYRQGRIEQAGNNMQLLLTSLQSGDEASFFNVIENEALSLHSLMMSSNPGYILMKPASILALEKIIEFRSQSGIRLGFTMDAGPNIHLIYFERDSELVKEFIRNTLSRFCVGNRWIDDAMGGGPVQLTTA